MATQSSTDSILCFGAGGEKSTEILGMVQPEKKYWDFLVYFLMFCCFMIIQGKRSNLKRRYSAEYVIQATILRCLSNFLRWCASKVWFKIFRRNVTLSPIVMEVETGRIWKVTAIGGTYLSLPCLWEEGCSSFVGVGSWHLVDYVGSLGSNHIGLWDFFAEAIAGVNLISFCFNSVRSAISKIHSVSLLVVWILFCYSHICVQNCHFVHVFYNGLKPPNADGIRQFCL